ncbi:MAG: DUF72 domain-containing protein [Candidatus Sumerlaeia bacterium]|nr:DUF72 domain-containing protein [Candidatus Sumerlaeia bacterium]
MLAKLYIGTAGWSYDDWWGIIYPPTKIRGFDELKFLGQFFNLVEINTTFYRPPSRRQTESWARRGLQIRSKETDFLFIVKLYQQFTHVRDNLDITAIADFSAALTPLVENNLLACILIQFPWSFRFTEENFYWVQNLTRALSGFPLAIEVRHSSWLCQPYYEFLSLHKIIFVNLDQPIFHHSVTPTDYVFSEDSYFRFHGRNKENWFREDISPDQRYNYLYSGEEINEWLPRIQRAQRLCKRVFIIFNNHFQAKAVCNALQLKSALTGATYSLPASLLQAYPQLNSIVRESPTTNNQKDFFR